MTQFRCQNEQIWGDGLLLIFYRLTDQVPDFSSREKKFKTFLNNSLFEFYSSFQLDQTRKHRENSFKGQPIAQVWINSCKHQQIVALKSVSGL